MDNRVAPPREFEDVITRFIEPPPNGLQIFTSKAKVLLFAASLGYRRRRRVKVERKGEPVRYDIFERAVDDSFIDAMAVAETGDLHVLDSERSDERIKIFEEYAHGGLIEMNRICFVEVGDPLSELVRVILEGEKSAESEIPGIDAAVLALLA
jgi:dnd system-associated protein 4